jgi:uncharacterized damage-inducible protein DinB
MDFFAFSTPLFFSSALLILPNHIFSPASNGLVARNFGCATDQCKRGQRIMQNLQPEQGTLLLQLALPVLKNEHKTTRRVIEAIPLDKGDYRPEPLAKSALELAWHIAATEQRIFGGIAAGAFDFTPIHRPETVRNSAELAQWFGDSFARNFERLSGLKGEQLVKVLDFRGVFQLPAVMYLEFTVKHTVHHRGQLSTYLRPMGSKVPAIYGESYDSAEAKKSAQA